MKPWFLTVYNGNRNFVIEKNPIVTDSDGVSFNEI